MKPNASDPQKIRFANYRLEHLIGSGGFARSYKGWDGDSDVSLAIKIVDANFSNSDFALATAFLDTPTKSERGAVRLRFDTVHFLSLNERHE